MKRWTLWLAGAAALVAGLVACPQFAPDDVCGYPGFCGDSSTNPDGGTDAHPDAPATCPSGNEPKDDPTCVSDALGIFVSPTGSDGNPGTKESPVATLKTALTKAAGKGFIFVCAGSYSESVDIAQSISIFGGFSCNDWTYSASAQPKFTGTKPDYVFHLNGANQTVIGDIELDAMDAPANTGQSSIGAFVASSQGVTLERMTIHAGKGADGVDGMLTPLNAQWPDAGALKGHDAPGADGGTENAVNCPGGSGTTTGGKGGNADGFTDGQNGLPAIGGGDGGLGGTQTIACQGGTDGKNGLAGDAGVAPTSLGDLTGTGWAALGGTAGAVGGPGQGGGGGGGRDNGSTQGGGGGGGAGACGGAGGGGGGGGGASIAIASVDSSLSVKASTLACSNAGNAGSGASGEAGQLPGGTGGVAQLFPVCSGGNGGNGGSGGGGAGGAGGVSVGVLSKGGSVNVDSATQTNTTVGTKGNKGTGAAGNDGIDGVAQATLAL